MKKIVGIMGPGDGATDDDMRNAYLLGRFIAKQGWVLLNGGRDIGVMHSANKGAKEKKGLTVGILPGEDYTSVSEYVDIPVLTGLGNARNNINVLTSRVIIACGIGAGTASEIALAVKTGKETLILSKNRAGNTFFKSMNSRKIHIMKDVDEACELLLRLV